MVYIIVFIIIYFIFNLYINKKVIFKPIILITVFLILISGLRDIGVDRDLETYYNIWKDIKANNVSIIEPLPFLIGKVSLNFFFFIFIFSTIGVALKVFAALKMSPYPLISLLLYYSHYYLLHEMTQVRAGVAVGFILLTIYFYIKSKKKFSFLALSLAICFHYSAIVALIIFAINKTKINVKLYLLLFIFFMALYFLNINLYKILDLIKLGFIANKIQIYQIAMNNGEQDIINVFNFAFFLQICIGLLALYICFLKKGNIYTCILTKLYWFGIFSYILFSSIPVFAFRISEIFLSVEYILIPNLVLLFKPKNFAKQLICLLGFGYLILYVFIQNMINNYSTIIFNGKI